MGVILVFCSIFTIAAIIAMFSGGYLIQILGKIKAEFGILSPLRIGALVEYKRREILGMQTWSPIHDTLIYGWPGSIIQFFISPYSDERLRRKEMKKRAKEERKQAMFRKLIEKNYGYDK